MVSTVKLVFFGIGGSWPVPERNLVAIGIQVDKEILLFDCPEGTQKAIMSSTMRYMKISKIFITHFHGDHFLGLAGLIQTMAMNNRTQDLEIYGPRHAIAIISAFLNIGYYSLSFNIKITELDGGAVLDFGHYVVKTLNAVHPVPTLAYAVIEKDQIKISREKMKQFDIQSREVKIIKEQGKIIKNHHEVQLKDIAQGVRKGRKIVYSGDTRPFTDMISFAHDCDVLIHDATTDSENEEKANEYGHSSSRQAAAIAHDAHCKQLYLVHISPRYKNTTELLKLEKEAKMVFANSAVAIERREYIIKVSKTSIYPLK